MTGSTTIADHVPDSRRPGCPFESARALLFGSADRIVDHLGPALVLQPRRRYRTDTVLIVDGTLVPTRDRAVAASGKNYRYSTNHQVVMGADTLPQTPSGDTPTVVAVGKPLPATQATAGSGRTPTPRPPSAPPPR